MSVEQLDLAGGVHIVGLTDRQTAALLFIEEQGGCSLDEVGALMHERQGKHSRDVRCSWCADAGASVMHELRQKALVERKPGHRWVSTRLLDSEAVFPAAAAAASESSGPARTERLGPDGARARSTDPATSHTAAASIGDLTGKQRAVLGVFGRHGGMHDEDLLLAYDVTPDVPKQTESGLRTRRHELVDQGLLEDSGRKARTDAGRPTIVWEITAEGRRALGGSGDWIPF